MFDEEKNNSLCMAPEWMAIVLDCRSWTYTDAMGVDAIREVGSFCGMDKEAIKEQKFEEKKNAEACKW